MTVTEDDEKEQDSFVARIQGSTVKLTQWYGTTRQLRHVDRVVAVLRRHQPSLQIGCRQFQSSYIPLYLRNDTSTM